MKKLGVLALLMAAALTISACGQTSGEIKGEEETVVMDAKTSETGGRELKTETVSVASEVTGEEAIPEINPEELFTDRDLLNSPELTGATELTVTDGSDIVIDREGTYVLSGSAENATILVEAESDDKVQLVLNGLSITNSDSPCIYVKSGDKVFVTTLSDSELSVTGTFQADGDTNTDAVIFSKEDLTLNDNGITSKDTIRITGSELLIECEGSAIEANDSIEMADGTVNVKGCNDGLHAENDEDDTTGYIFIGGGKLSINAADDAIHATTLIRIDGGELTVTGSEGLEGTVILINDGTVQISASDDGINAAQKSTAYRPRFEMNGGSVTIEMGSGDTDGVDSNGDIIINGGTLSITGQSAFDYDGNAEYNGGTILVNGEETDAITNQMMGGMGGMGPMGGMGGMAPTEGMNPPEGMEGGMRRGPGGHGRMNEMNGAVSQ